ncbi:MAG: M20/M25/M40 family metallo-hydrolase, partial [Ilumatobacteraceae bacterium]
EVRTTAEGHRDEIDAVAAAIVAAVRLAEPGATVQVSQNQGRVGLGVDAADPFVAAVASAVGAATHREPVLTAAPYWTDAALHDIAGTPAVVLGPVGQGLHEDLEWVTTRSLHQCREALTTLARDWCA